METMRARRKELICKIVLIRNIPNAWVGSLVFRFR
jgi:hypothetical protein